MIELIENVQNWAREKGIYDHSTELDQKVRMIGELTNEFLGAIDKGKGREEILTELGDVYVFGVNWRTLDGCSSDTIEKLINTPGCGLEGELIVWIDNCIKTAWSPCVFFSSLADIAYLMNSTPEECLQLAYDKIKNRKTKMVNGKAVKEGDL